jgi:hypothetical protein
VVTKVGNNAFTFPVGASNLYRPISISAPGVATDTYTAQYINANPDGSFPNASRAVTLDHVSGAEYWLLNRTVGTSNVNVTLSWGSNSGLVGNLSSLRVAAWNGSLWTDQGNGGTTGNTTAGTVVTGAPSATYFGPYTLATIDNSNPLPVVLSDFSCAYVNNHVELKWSTQSEINSDYFDVERSNDGIQFAFIQKVEAAGTSNTKKNYSIKDFEAPNGFVYYRLKQVDLDGAFVYYQVCVVETPSDANASELYPNPASSFTTFSLKGQELRSLQVNNSLGQSNACSYVIESGKLVLNTTSLAPGLYIVEVSTDKGLTKQKLLIQR